MLETKEIKSNSSFITDLILKQKEVIIFTFFVLLTVIMTINHEPWRDEAQAWLIARDAGPYELFRLMGYEGSPMLWQLMLLPFAKLGFPFWTIKIVHAIIISAAIYIFLKNCPVTVWMKVLIISGYYMVFEYNVIARNYSISILFLFIVASLYKKRFEKPFTYGFFIGLLACTNIHSIVIAGIITSVFVFELIFEIKIYKNLQNNLKYIFSLLIPIVFFLLSLVQILPPKDLAGFLKEWNLGIGIHEIFKKMCEVLVDAFIPIPIKSINFWNSNIITGSLVYITAGILFAILILFFMRYLKCLYIMLATYLSLGLLIVLKYGFQRHIGLIYITFIFCFWISFYDRDDKDHLPKIKLSNKIIAGLICIIFISNIFAGERALYYDFNNDFSEASKVAGYLNKNGLTDEKTLLVSYKSYSVSAVSALLNNKKKFYYPEYNKFMTYMVWNNDFQKTRNGIPYKDFMLKLDNIIKQGNYKHIILVANLEINAMLKPYANKKDFEKHFKKLKEFKNGIVYDENYLIYEMINNY